MPSAAVVFDGENLNLYGVVNGMSISIPASKLLDFKRAVSEFLEMIKHHEEPTTSFIVDDANIRGEISVFNISESRFRSVRIDFQVGDFTESADFFATLSALKLRSIAISLKSQSQHIFT